MAQAYSNYNTLLKTRFDEAHQNSSLYHIEKLYLISKTFTFCTEV